MHLIVELEKKCFECAKEKIVCIKIWQKAVLEKILFA